MGASRTIAQGMWMFCATIIGILLSEPSKEYEPASEKEEGSVCLVGIKNAALVPCGHLVCFSCGWRCQLQCNGRCPVCIRPIKTVMRVF
jgi:hypothetical protein